MWPFSSGNVLDQTVAQALPQQALQFGSLSGGFAPQQKPPVPIEQPQQNKILSNPQLMNALGRMGSAIARSGGSNQSFAAALGSGTDAFQDEVNRQQEFDLQKQRIEAETRLRDAQIQKAQKDAQYGVESGGFEGDIARARVILNDPMSPEREKAVAQAVIETAERMQGSYDPVTGEFRYNPRAQIGGGAPMAAGGVSPQPMPTPQPANGMPPAPSQTAPAGGLLPPPSLGGEAPDKSMFAAPATGNRKVEAALQEEAGKAEIAGRRTVNEGVGKVDSETFGAIANQTRSLSSMLPQLQRIETLASNTKTGGLGAARLEFGKIFGLDLDGVPEAQAITAIQNAIGPSLRTPGSGASSDKDVAIFMSSIPTLMNTPGGIREINKTYSQLLDRKKEEEKIARKLLREDGTLERFYEETEKLGPVFKSGGISAPSSPATTTDYTNMADDELLRLIQGGGR